MTKAKPEQKDDLSWREVAQLGQRYLRIPAALLLAEALYWFLTMPSDSLAIIQVTEAWIWNGLTNVLYGEGTATLSTHNGWLTRIDFHHSSFPGPFDSVGLYVSDECAGVHEMVFLSTLIWMTDGVPQRLKLKSILVGCSIVYVLNILRLVVFYPIALDSCLAMPNQQECLQPMWEFHAFVYEFGFLVVLVFLWLIWFTKVGGPSRTNEAAFQEKEQSTFRLRKQWEGKHIALSVAFVLLIFLSVLSIYMNDDATVTREVLSNCNFSELVTPECEDAQRSWDDTIQTAWSISMIGGIGLSVVGVTYGKEVEQTQVLPKEIESDESTSQPSDSKDEEEEE